MIYLKNIPDHLIEDSIISLKENRVPESKILEYKRALPSDNNEDKREFLADISSFANTVGGNIIFGIREEKGIPVEIPGLEIGDYDKLISKLTSILRDCIEPRIPGIDIKPLKLSSGAKILIILIPKSFNAPHVIKLGGHWRFYSRHSIGKYPLEVSELRSIFTSTVALREKIKNFRNEKISQKNIVCKYQFHQVPRFIYIIFHYLGFD
ncbi:MAG: helix-turn-helix domain-containing protein [Clostridiales bacterium]